MNPPAGGLLTEDTKRGFAHSFPVANARRPDLFYMAASGAVWLVKADEGIELL